MNTPSVATLVLLVSALLLCAGCVPGKIDAPPQAVACAAADAPTSGVLRAHDLGQPSAAEQVVVERLNRARRDPAAEAARLGIALDEGTSPPLVDGPRPPLALHALLLQAARAHSQDMLPR